MTRTFIALETNDAVQSHLEAIMRKVAPALPGLRWVDVHGIHLTLAFLGELDTARLAQAIEAAQYASSHHPPFSYILSQPDIFGSVRHPRVLWMGIEEPSGALARLHRSLNHELVQRGFEVDKRPFSPHLTLARGKAPLSLVEQNSLEKLLADHTLRATSSSVVARISAICVMKSELSSGGARYTILQRTTLQG